MTDPPGTICSARGCRAPASWVLAWNNPRLHPPERRKTWLACDEHRAHLSTFLGSRGMLRETVPITDWPPAGGGEDGRGEGGPGEGGPGEGGPGEGGPGARGRDSSGAS